MLISEATSRQMLRSLGAETIKADAGEFLAIFDAPFELVPGDVQAEQSPPTLTARTVDVKSLPKNATVRRGEEVYRVVRHEPDGTGMSRLILKKP